MRAAGHDRYAVPHKSEPRLLMLSTALCAVLAITTGSPNRWAGIMTLPPGNDRCERHDRARPTWPGGACEVSS